MKKMLLAPACVAVLSFALIATQTTPTTTNAEDRSNDLGQEDATISQNDSVAGATGADVIVADLAGLQAWGNIGNVRAFSLGTTSCNAGDTNLNWIQNSTLHPVIAQNVYRYDADGRLLQLGQGWLKHSFCALQFNGQCPGNCPGQGGCLSFLAPGCVDPYTAARNGGQTRLGPRFEVNAFTGQFPWPHTARGVTGNALYKRIQIDIDEINPAMNPGADWWSEGQYVSRDDALAGNHFNNVSVKRLFISGAAPNINMFTQGFIVQETSAVEHWPTVRPGANTADMFVPGEGLFHAGSYVNDNGDGTWNYYYAVHNQNSDLSGYSFAVPVDDGVNVTNITFEFPEYHSGEPYTNGNWTSAHANDEVRWTADDTFAGNANANALRWGTTYSFGFTADVGPENGSVSLQLFKDPNTTVTGSIDVPSAPANLLGDMNCDGLISVSDIGPFVLALTDPAGYAAQFPDCDINNGDLNDDGNVSVGDIGLFVALLAG